MTTSEMKKDAKARLEKAGIAFDKLTARTVSFAGFGYGNCTFVKVHNPQTGFGPHRREAFSSVPAPSKGGYSVEWSDAVFSGG
jgi:hypothetical protein